jgi:HEAT repeat protein
MAKPKAVPFAMIIAALLDEQSVFPPRYLHRFSDLPLEDAQSLRQAWSKIPTQRRSNLMEDLEELSQADDLLSFEEVCRLALQDPAPNVRISAIKILREYEQIPLIPDFIHFAQHDPDAGVRAAATAGLGTFIYMGEVDDLHPATLKRVEECLLGILNGSNDTLVRRRALEALGYSTREEVNPAIERAYSIADPDWLISALNAMGRSADQVWNPKVVAMFDHTHPVVRAEAASAAGDLEIKSAVPALLRMLRDPDLDVRMASIWALSQIGGKGVRSALERLLDDPQDEEEEGLLEKALENLDFTEDLGRIALLEINDSEGEEDDLFGEDEFDDLEDEGDNQA